MKPAFPRAHPLHSVAAALAADDVARLLQDKPALRRIVELADAASAAMAPHHRRPPAPRGLHGC